MIKAIYSFALLPGCIVAGLLLVSRQFVS